MKGGVVGLMNKKLMVGVLTILVVLMTVQGFRPVMAEDGTNDNNPTSNAPGPTFNSFTVLVLGQGSVCWSSDYANGCTQSSSTVAIQDGHSLTLNAKGVGGSRFIDWNCNSPSMSGWDSILKANTLPSMTVTPYSAYVVSGETITAIFN